MKTAKLTKEFVVDIHCPVCGEVHEGPSGALSVADWEWKEVPEVIECRACGEQFRKPTTNPWAKRTRKGASHAR